MDKQELVLGETYTLAFDGDGWECRKYSGPAKLLKANSEDFGTGVQHYDFLMPDGEVCTFPESSIGRLVVRPN